MTNMMNQSVSGLSRLIRKITGHTYKELVQRKRFRKAVELLIETEIPVNDIVSEVGYENNSYFYRKFKERYHITPNEYRITHKDNISIRV